MKLVVSLVASMALLGAKPVSAAPTVDQTAQQPAPKAGAADRVCENIVSTGSRIASKRVCMTREQWTQRQRDDRDEVEKDQRSVNIGCVVINTRTPTPNCN